MKNIIKVDSFVKKKTRMKNSTMDGANNTRVSGIASNKNLMNDIKNKMNGE